MRIDSSTINMGSARSYQASEATVGRYRVTDYLTGVTLSGTSVGTMVSREKEDTYGENQTSLKKVSRTYGSGTTVSAQRHTE